MDIRRRLPASKPLRSTFGGRPWSSWTHGSTNVLCGVLAHTSFTGGRQSRDKAADAVLTDNVSYFCYPQAKDRRRRASRILSPFFHLFLFHQYLLCDSDLAIIVLITRSSFPASQRPAFNAGFRSGTKHPSPIQPTSSTPPPVVHLNSLPR
jgi:hypothetical protein